MGNMGSHSPPHLKAIFAGAIRQGQISLSGRERDPMFPIKNQNNKFIILLSFCMTFCNFVVWVNTEKKCELTANLASCGLLCTFYSVQF